MKSRPFTYNNGDQIPGTEKFGDLTVGIPTNGYQSTNLQWWNGPDEDLGYVVSKLNVDENGNGLQPTPIEGVFGNVGFNRTKTWLYSEFLNLVNSEFGQNFTNPADAKVWLESNSKWTSFIDNLQNSFRNRVLTNGGEFESFSCLESQINDLINKDLLDSASFVLTPNGYKENVLFSVTPSPVGTNLLLRSSEFENSIWTKNLLTIASTFSTAPNTLLEARTVQVGVDASASRHRLSQGLNSFINTNTTYTFNIYAKKNQHRWIQLNFVVGFDLNNWANFDLENGVIGNTGTGAIATIQNVGNGWYRLSIVGVPIAAQANYSAEVIVINNTNSGRYPSYQSTVAENVFDIWGAQLELGSTAGTYIPTTTRQAINETICDLTVTRATTGTRVNADGDIEQVPYNLLSRSEEFENASWTKSNVTITANSTLAPNGTLTTDTITNTATSNNHVTQIATGTPNSFYVASCYFKRENNNIARLILTDLAIQEIAVTFNLSTLTLNTISSPGVGWDSISYGFSSEQNGFIRLWLSARKIGPNTIVAVRAGFYTSVVGSFDYLWGAQLVNGTQPKDYFPTTNRFNVPRLDYSNGSCPSILVEPQMTNSWTNNNDTSGYTSNTNAVKGATISNAFGEGFNGFQYNFIGGGEIFISAAKYIRVFDTRNLPVQRLCLYIKAPSSDFFGINYTNVGEVIYRFSTLEVSNSTIGAIKKINEDTYALYIHTDTAVTGQFSQVRVAFVTSLTNDDNVDGSAILGLGYYQGAAAGTVQMQNYNYSPIITGAIAVTRNADYLYNNTTAIDLIGQTEGTIFLDFDRTLIFAGIKSLLALYSVINDETFHIQTSSNSYTSISITIVSVANGVSVGRGMSLLEGRNKLAVVYSTSGTKIFLNGTQLTPLTNTALPVMNVINLSNRTSGRIYGPIRQFSLWKTQITDAQAIQLTTL